MLLRTALIVLAAMTTLAAAPAPDPDAYLEEIEGAPALAFARAENARSLPILQNDPRYAGLHADALSIVTAKDRIPAVDFAGEGELRNFWQDAAHVRGVWRTTSLDSYRKPAPQWRTILDLDAVSAAEKANWVWKGANCLAPEERLCLVQLSDGGKDAVEVREFDTRTGAFVSGGFVSPQSKQDVAWIDTDTLLIGRDWGADTLTESGYPFVLKAWKRGTPLSAARELFRGAKTDVAVQPAVLRDADGHVQAVIAQRQVSFFEAEYHLLTAGGAKKLPFPLRSTLQGLVDGQLILTLEQEWPEQGFREGDLVAYDLAALKATPATARGVLVLRPSESQAIEQVATTRGRLVVALYENVKGGIVSFAHGSDGWTSKALEMPGDVSVSIASTSERDDRMLVNVAGFLTPNTQRLADAASGAGEVLKTMPARFDASNLQVDQHWATSKDGTRVPYFVVHRKDLKLDGTAPTLLYAYGGFQVSITPSYSGVTGKLWLERGGVYVVANIRGGGEFGPRWHNAGLKLNRQRVYDDFFAVSEDLIARKITSPRRLGIMGGSNGGLLMGVALTQRPELYNAIVIQVPLFDMIGYTHIGAGASWVGEYGDPAIPAERAVIDTYSPYQNLRAGKPYPEVYIETSTKDDRVHPAHARKAAARLKALGYSYLYYENIDGGHAAAANLNETAKRVALEYTYLTRKLMD
ncbi:prolyl oligopeptidase family protein [Phenylobacterium sp.]|uniref:prolyl oligopeptidase family serine peptidase n=1 Tax=Phenylobacterium sp. TaxID=1871053 RepID=UPI0027370A0C|nr:prolyl oligopeptidase family serine peptidase [Phenylobacterium sp.]MDP3660497.1 prolyl oligopeptidase family serine peptidase [Phenylobacterium sp.]